MEQIVQYRRQQQHRRDNPSQPSSIRQQSLTRYDSTSLRPLSSSNIGNDGPEPPRFSTSTFPRRMESWTSGTGANPINYAVHPPPPPFSADEPQHKNSSVNKTMGIIPRLSTADEFDWPARLHRNHHLAIHRVAFLLLKFPAMAAGLVAALLLFGAPHRPMANARMKVSPWLAWLPSFVDHDSEWRAGVAGMGTAGMMLASLVLFGQQSHWHSPSRAHAQAIWRVIFSLLGICLCIPTGVFAAIAADQIRFEKTEDQSPTKLDRQHRSVYCLILVGVCALMLILSAITLIHGMQAIVRHRKDQKQAERHARFVAAKNASKTKELLPQGIFNGTKLIGAFNTHTDKY